MIIISFNPDILAQTNNANGFRDFDVRVMDALFDKYTFVEDVTHIYQNDNDKHRYLKFQTPPNAQDDYEDSIYILGVKILKYPSRISILLEKSRKLPDLSFLKEIKQKSNGQLIGK